MLIFSLTSMNLLVSYEKGNCSTIIELTSINYFIQKFKIHNLLYCKTCKDAFESITNVKSGTITDIAWTTSIREIVVLIRQRINNSINVSLCFNQNRYQLTSIQSI